MLRYVAFVRPLGTADTQIRSAIAKEATDAPLSLQVFEALREVRARTRTGREVYFGAPEEIVAAYRELTGLEDATASGWHVLATYTSTSLRIRKRRIRVERWEFIFEPNERYHAMHGFSFEDLEKRVGRR